MLYTFFSSKCSLFHNSNVFDSCIIHILYTGCAKIKKNNSVAKRLCLVPNWGVQIVLGYILSHLLAHVRLYSELIGGGRWKET